MSDHVNNDNFLGFRCISSRCFPGYEFDADKPLCPRCKASGAMVILVRVKVHFLFADETGPIQGMERRYRSACNPDRVNFATPAGGTLPHTDQPGAVTCPACIKTAEFQRAVSVHPLLGIAAITPGAAITPQGPGCC